MKVKDYYFSQEEFEIIDDTKGVKKTFPLPQNLDTYYNSENYISHSNQNKSLIEKAYTWVQQLNFNYKYKILKKYSNYGKVLDYGCGNGSFLEYLKNKTEYQLFGFEPNLDLEINGVKIYSSLEEIDENFDIITLWHVFEHIENREEILELLRSKLNPKGVLIIAIPNHTSLDAKYYKQNWAAWDVPRHVYHYSKNGAIQYFVKENHFYLDKIYPMPFDSYYISILSSKYSKKIFQKIVSPIIAMTSNIKALKNNEWSSLIYVLKKEL